MLVFVLIRLLPGDPVHMQMAMLDLGTLTPEAMQQQYETLRRDLGLDQAIVVQYFNWFSNVIQGDFGRSMVRHFNIAEDLQSRMTVTLFLGIITFIVSNILGMFLGTISAIRRGSILDTLVTAVANVGITAPAFLIAILGIYVFGYVLGWLPIFGYQLPWAGNFSLSIRQGILPIFVMSLGPMAITARQTRSSVLEVLNQDHVRTAWAKGTREKMIILRHVLKNGLIPIISLQGAMVRMIFGGSAIVESIFVIPGVGQMIVTAMFSADYTVIQAVALVLTFVAVISNLLVDLLYGWVDPRIHYS